MSASAYRQRLLDPLLDDLLAAVPSLVVVGPRAVGKTTTIGRRARTTVRLDAEAEAAAFRADPDAALRGLEEPVLLDEWQEVPAVFGAVRRAIDDAPLPGRFLLTGSVRAELDADVWPGTGRAVRLSLYPMTVREKLGLVAGSTFFDRLAAGADLVVPTDSPDLRGYVDLALESGFPVPALQSGSTRRHILESYLDQLLTRDIERLESGAGRRRDTQRLRRYAEASAVNSGGVLDHKTIYDAAQVNRITANAYEELLTNLFVVDQVPAWSSNRLKRLVYQPKRYLVDSSLIAAALRLDARGVLSDGDLLGRVLDTFVAMQLRAELAVSASRPRLFHLRTEQGRHEIDLLAEFGGGGIIGVEVKAGAAPNDHDARHLAWLRDRLADRFTAGVVLHTGPRSYRLGDRITAVPISTLWG